MEQRPSGEANSSSANQVLPRTSANQVLPRIETRRFVTLYPTVCPYPEQDKPNPSPLILFIEYPFEHCSPICSCV